MSLISFFLFLAGPVSKAQPDTSTPPGHPSDTQIQLRASKVLHQDPQLRRAELHVDVNNNVATLSGTVDNLSTKNRAVDDVKRLEGVKRVQNRLFVKSIESRPDPDIAIDVNRLLTSDSQLIPFSISARVKDGVVTLSGDVDTESQKIEAEQSLTQVRGIKKVVNNLRIYHP